MHYHCVITDSAYQRVVHYEEMPDVGSPTFESYWLTIFQMTAAIYAARFMGLAKQQPVNSNVPIQIVNDVAY